MNYMIIKIVVQRFVDKNLDTLVFVSGDWAFNIQQIGSLAKLQGEDEVTDLLDYLVEKDIAHTMFAFKEEVSNG